MSQSTVLKGVVSAVLLLQLSCSAMQRNMSLDEVGYKEFTDQYRVKRYDIDPILQRMNTAQLRQYFAAGCKIRAKQLENGDYILRAFIPGKGGGAFFGAITAVVGTVATGVAAAAAAVGTTVVTLSPAAGAAAGVVVAHAGMAATVYATGVAVAAPTP